MEAVDINDLWWNRGRLPEDNVAWHQLTPEGRVRASSPYWTHNMMVAIHEAVVQGVFLGTLAVDSKDLVNELAADALEWIEHRREGCYND